MLSGLKIKVNNYMGHLLKEISQFTENLLKAFAILTFLYLFSTSLNQIRSKNEKICSTRSFIIFVSNLFIGF